MPRPIVPPPMPHYTIRLNPELKRKVEEISIIYGAESTSAFVRDLLAAVCSGDVSVAMAFHARLEEKMSGQTQLEMKAKIDERIAEGIAEGIAAATPVRAKRRVPKRKGGRSAGRT